MYSMLSIAPPLTSATDGISVPGIVISLGVGVAIWLAATFVISRISRRVASGSTFFKKPHFRWVAPALRALDHERRVQRANTIGSLLNSVVGVLVATITTMYVLRNLDIDIAPLLTSVGILGIAIGFGAQQLIRDFLAGIFITIEDQYGIGDVIETSEVVGTVESMGLRITRVLAEDGTIWYLRNGEILRVGNRSQGTYVPRKRSRKLQTTLKHQPRRKPESSYEQSTRRAREAEDADAERSVQPARLH
ncbi:mechanosensitive ion channel family protein [Arthrobacter sp. SA17]